MSLSCPKCGRGKAYFYPRELFLESGARLQEVVCVNCSAIIASRLVETEAIGRPEDFPSGSVAVTASPLSPEVKLSRREQMEKHRKPCQVAGCEGSYIDLNSKYGLCKEHGKRLAKWIHNRRTGNVRIGPPVALVNGCWVPRGELLPGVAA